MLRTTLLTTAALMALATAAQAAAPASNPAPGIPAQGDTQSAFSQAIQSIKGWFGADTPETAQATPADTTTAAMDDVIQVPPPVDGVQNIEPAAGAFDDDIIQVPPPYYGPQSDASATPRASAFDNAPAIAAFGDQQGVPADAAVAAATVGSAADIASIAPAAGGDEIDPTKLNCDAILKAADEAEEGDIPDTALIEACETPVDSAGEPLRAPAQPAFEGAPGLPQALPSTQPAAGEPPIGGAVMPGEQQAR